VAGGGVHYSDATGALASWTGRAGIPVGVTQAGKGVLPDAHPSCLGAVGATGTLAANRIARSADLVVLIGTRLSDFTTASKTLFECENVRFVAIQIDAFDAHKHGALPLVGDARAVLEDLDAALQGYRVEDAYTAEIRGAKDEWEHTYSQIVHPHPSARLQQAEVIRILNEHLGSEATIVHAAGGLPGDLHKLWKSRGPDEYHSEYGYSCMGYEIAGALGVKMARPDREVYALVGDGSYLMLHTEIVTSIQEGLKVTVILLDNGGYQCIHWLQQACGGRSFGNEFRSRDGQGRMNGNFVTIDFVQNARSLGAAALRAETETELVAALESARRELRTTLVHVPVEPGAQVPGWAWWDVPVAEVSDVPQVQAAREQYVQNRTKQVFHY
jgi:3D-(3,5/4)-trihydroxycyclohexane-1,2-dione acylhydrolase (decyclizing)